MIAVNHQSTLDALLIVSVIKNAFCVAKEGVLWLPYIGKACKHSQVIVKRGNPKQTVRAVNWAIKYHPGQSIIFFPEGTRSKTGKLGFFKKGAAAAAIRNNIPIIPVTIDGAHAVLPKGSLLRLNPGTSEELKRIRIIFGNQIYVESLSVEHDAARITQEIRDVIEATLEKNKDKALKQ